MSWFRRRKKETNPIDEASVAAPISALPRVIDISAAGLSFDGLVLEELTVSALTDLLGAARVQPLDGPTPDGYQPKTLVIWDAVGVRATTEGGDEVSSLSVHLSADPEWNSFVQYDPSKLHPASIFSGKFSIDGLPLLEAIPAAELRKALSYLEVKTGYWQAVISLNSTYCGEIGRMTFVERLAKIESGEIAEIIRNAAHPFRSVDVSYQPPRPISGKWLLPAVTEPVLQFSSFNFRLAIIQELMYSQDLLKPRFDVHDFAEDLGEESFDPYQVEYGIIPQVQAWFSELPIPLDLAERVETLLLEGGNQIFLQLIPEWDGEDQRFVIDHLTDEDLAPFTRLHEINDCGFLGPDALATLSRRGIIVK